MQVYVAGPLFTHSERERLRRVGEAVEDAGGTPVLPIPDDGFEVESDREAVYRSCVDAVDDCDAVVAVLDGADADSGVAYEVGYARAQGMPVLGIRGDYRTLGPEGPVNTMLGEGVTTLAVVTTPEETAEAVADFLEDPPVEGEARLTRDDVPRLRARSGGVDARQVEGEAYVEHLKRYLADRAEALVEADEVQEVDLVADLLEGVETLAAERGIASDELRERKKRRRDEFGGLEDGVVVRDPPEGSP